MDGPSRLPLSPGHVSMQAALLPSLTLSSLSSETDTLLLQTLQWLHCSAPNLPDKTLTSPVGNTGPPQWLPCSSAQPSSSAVESSRPLSYLSSQEQGPQLCPHPRLAGVAPFSHHLVSSCSPFKCRQVSPPRSHLLGAAPPMAPPGCHSRPGCPALPPLTVG